MPYKVIYLFASIFLVVGCQTQSNDDKIVLNDGEKWKVNLEMMPPIEASAKLISEFASDDIKDYQALAEKLKENNQMLISSCTMTGKSHEELHKWLHPYLSLVDELSNANTEQLAKQVLDKIHQSFDTFDQYFQ